MIAQTNSDRLEGTPMQHMERPKKVIELLRLSRLRELISDFPTGTIEATAQPDFLVHWGAKIVGIELTNLHREVQEGGTPQRASDAMRNKVTSIAQEIYESSKGPLTGKCREADFLDLASSFLLPVVPKRHKTGSSETASSKNQSLLLH